MLNHNSYRKVNKKECEGFQRGRHYAPLNHNLHEKILQKYWKNRYQEALEPINNCTILIQGEIGHSIEFENKPYIYLQIESCVLHLSDNKAFNNIAEIINERSMP